MEMDSSLWNPKPKWPLPPENRLGPVFCHSHGKQSMLMPTRLVPSEDFGVHFIAVDLKGLLSSLYPFDWLLARLCFGGGKVPKPQFCSVYFLVFLPSCRPWCSSSEVGGNEIKSIGIPMG